jgi:hypothetical protein
MERVNIYPHFIPTKRCAPQSESMGGRGMQNDL